MSIVARQGGGYSGFSPSDIGGLSLWLDAADPSTLTLSGSNVTQWRDKSINAYTTSTFYNAPSYDSTTNAIVFAGSNGFTVPYSASLNVESAFIVIRASNMANAATMIGPANANNARQFLFAGGRLMTTASDVANYLSTGVVLNSSTTYSVGFVNTGSTLTHFVNGGVYATRDIATNYASGRITCIGSRSFSTTGVHYLIGSIHEIIVFNTAVSTTERQQIEGYLAHKWGLYPNLPTAHPFLRYKPIARRFQPSDTGSLALWLDAADSSTLTLSGSNVTQWRDKSGNGYSGTSTAGRLPSYASNVRNGLSAVQYATGQTTIIPSFVCGPTVSIFKVYYPINQSSGSPFIEHGSNVSETNGFFLHSLQSSQFAIKNTSGLSYYTTLPNVTVSNTWQLLEGINPDPQNNQMSFYTNGTFRISTTAVTGSNVTANLFINGRNNTNTLSWPSYLAELIIFNIAVSTQQRQQVEAYLAHKWGLRNSLPTSHIFRSQIPQVPILSGPLTVPGCALWLDAADSSTLGLSGSNVTQWRDKSGNSRHAVLYSTNPGPILTTNGLNSLPVMTFTSNQSQRMIVNSSFSLGNVFVVGRTTSGGGGPFFTGLPDSFFGSSFQGTFTAYVNVKTGSGYNVISAGGTSLNTFYLYGASLVSSSASVFINGTLWANGNIPGTPNASTGLFISSDQGATNFVSSQIAEILFFSATSLSPQQRQQIEGYLAHKWGLVANLPPAHPFKTFRP